MSPDAGYLAFVQQNAVRDPAAVAFELSTAEGSTLLTYAGLVERVQRLGEALRRAGFGDGARIAVCMENRPAWPVAYLAVWYAGSATVPLDPALDEEVLARLLRHSGAVACVTSAEMSGKLRAACAALSTPPLLLCPDLQAGERRSCDPWDGLDPAAAVGEDPAPAQEPDPAVVESLPDLEPLVSFDAFVDQHGSEAHDWRPAVPDDETLGSIMYTSGTTGDPKGVMIRQRAVLENLRAGAERVHFSAQDRILGVLPLFHVLPLITNCLGPLYIGARVVFLYELTAEAIMAAFRRHHITVFVCVPAFFYRFHDRLAAAVESAPSWRRRTARLLIAASRACRRRFGWSPGRVLLRKAHAPFGRKMRLFITGGAKMNAQVFDDFLDWGFTLAQGYGLTEATAIITATPLDELRGDTVGTPIEGVKVRIDQPDGEGIGEVWATGPSLMTGYYRNREATEAALTDGWLRTGDLGRLLDNGHLQITGRAKDVIVLASGKNIYPDELEGYYGQSELVEEICIVGIPDRAGRGERLHAIVVPDREAARRRGYVNAREMITWDLESRGAKLPGPQRLTSLSIRTEPLPRTPTRKIKRYVLLQELAGEAAAAPCPEDAPPREAVAAPRPEDAPHGESAAAPGAEDAPRGEAAEETDAVIADGSAPRGAAEICAVVARYAKRDAVSPSSHLDLDLGLESLDRIELMAELQRDRGVTLDDEAVGRIHTVADVIRALEAAEPGPEAASPRERGERTGDRAARGRDDNWAAVLANVPAGLEAHLRRRPVFELFAFALLRCARAAWRVCAGFRAGGGEEIPHHGPLLLCSNHTSYLDPLALCMALPRHAMARVFFVGYSEYFDGPVGGMLARLVRNIPIDPNRNLERAMQAAAEGLRRGMVLIIFPEGGRSLDGNVQEFRRGAAILAAQLQVPMVPAGVWGTHRVWPRQGPKQRHPVAVEFGAALAPQPQQNDEELLEVLRADVIELVGRAARG